MTVHLPVLLEQVVDGLALKPGQTVMDGTAGAAGHSIEMLRAVQPNGFLLGLDRDPQMVEIAKENLRTAGFKSPQQYQIENIQFSRFSESLQKNGITKVDKVLLDLGVNSLHLDRAERGFSLKREGPLDMRMNPLEAESRSAAVVVATEDAKTLAMIFDKYGEERFAKRIAQVIVERRESSPITTTLELREIVAQAIPRKLWPQGIDPATRVFQALRIEVNRELAELESTLAELPSYINLGGRVAIISFHSLEDRLVKNAFKKWAEGCTCPPEFPICICKAVQRFKIITSKPLIGSQAEIEKNPRARSAKLRIIERIAL